MNRLSLRSARSLACFAATLVATYTATFAAAADSAPGALKWDHTELQFKAEYGQDEIEARYGFTNDSARTVTVENIHASCGCTVPTLEKKVYGPGESGELKALFTVGSRQGAQHKTITVSTKEDGAEQTYQLTLEVDIPIPVALKPRVRFWTVGDAPSTQDITVTLNENNPMRITELVRRDTEESAGFDYAIETLEAGRKYVIKITPKSMTEKSRDVMLLASEDDRKGVLADFPIYLYVR